MKLNLRSLLKRIPPEVVTFEPIDKHGNQVPGDGNDIGTLSLGHKYKK